MAVQQPFSAKGTVEIVILRVAEPNSRLLDCPEAYSNCQSWKLGSATLDCARIASISGKNVKKVV